MGCENVIIVAWGERRGGRGSEIRECFRNSPSLYLINGRQVEKMSEREKPSLSSTKWLRKKESMERWRDKE